MEDQYKSIPKFPKTSLPGPTVVPKHVNKETLDMIQARYEKAASHQIFYKPLTKALVEEWPSIRVRLQAGDKLAEAALELVMLRKHKAMEGKDEFYIRERPIAWAAVDAALDAYGEK